MEKSSKEVVLSYKHKLKRSGIKTASLRGEVEKAWKEIGPSPLFEKILDNYVYL